MNRARLGAVFLEFVRLGCTAFGGPAMIPYIREMAVARRGWLDESSFQLGMACAQAIPGATAMQMAAYVGLRARGTLGAAVAYLGFGLPAFALITGLSAAYFAYRDVAAVMAVSRGLQAVVVAVVAHASLNFVRRYLKRPVHWLLALAAGLWLGLRLNPIAAIVGCMALGAALLQDESPPEDMGSAARGPVARRYAETALLALAAAAGLAFLGAAGLDRLVELSLMMAKIDCFAFGGGYVSIPLMLHEVVEVRGWLSTPQLLDGVALGQLTPGPIVMTAAFIGYAVFGLFGAACAAVAVFTPSLLILLAVTPVFDAVASSPLLWRALRGSLVSLVGLMAAVTVRFAVVQDWDWASVLLCLAAFTALRLRVDVLWVVLACGGLSLVLLR
jgi:chromate transporter